MPLPIGKELPVLGARVDVEFAPGPEDAFEAGPFEGRVTKLRKRSFSVHFDSDGTDASVHLGKHRYRILPPKKMRSAGASEVPATAVRPPFLKRGDQNNDGMPAQKSDYERAREEKIAANEAMLQKLGLSGPGAITHSLQQAASASPRAPRSRRTSAPPGELRRSTRDRSSASGRRLVGSLDVEGLPRRRRLPGPVDAAAIDAAEQTAGASTGETFTKVMTPSMVEYSFKFGIGAAGAAVLPVYGSSPGGSRKMICWLVADETSFGQAVFGSEGMEWPCVYHDHSKNFDGGWYGFAKAHGLRTGDVCVFERLLDKFKPTHGNNGFTNGDLSRGWVRLRVVLHRGSGGSAGVVGGM